MLDLAKQGLLKVSGDGSHYISLVHAQDMARAIVLALRNKRPGACYNIVDDRPVRQAELYDYMAALAGGPAPERVRVPAEAAPASLRCSNAKAKKELGFEPEYPSYVEGLEAIR